MATHMKEHEACSFAMAMANWYAQPMVLRALYELDVLEIIKRAGPGVHLSPAQIATQLPTKNPSAASMLDRMLRIQASYSILSYSIETRPDGGVQTLYGLTPVCEFLTKDENGVGLSNLGLVNTDKIIMDSWYHLKDAVLDGGIAFEKAHNMLLYEFLGRDHRFNKIFDNGMLNHSKIIMKKIIENYKGFVGFSTLVHVGGGTGASLNTILSKYPKIKGINFDLPHIIEDAPTYNAMEHIGGDMFVSIPKGDAIFMKWICHEWSDEQCINLLKNCYTSLPDHGKVILCEYIFPAIPETSHAVRAAYQIDALMLVSCGAGKVVRTEKEFEHLAKAAGFDGFRVACSAYGTKIIELLKNKNKMGLITNQEEQDDVCSFAMEITSGSVPPMVLKAVVELNVLEIIKKAGPNAHLSPAEIAAQLPTKNPDAATMLDRMLRLLASYSILSYSLQTRPDGQVERLYGLTPVCQFLTKNEDGVSMSAFFLTIHDQVLMQSWYYLKDAVLNGGVPFNKAHGNVVYEQIGTDVRFNKVFNKGMSDHSAIIIKRMLEIYKGFEGVSTLIDVGGGTGATLHTIVSKYPTIKGINFELPHVIEDAPAYEGVEHVSGNMFVSVPKADAMFTKWVCHSWTDEECSKFLKNCYDSLPENGKMIVCEYIRPVTPETNHSAKTVFQCDCIMLASFPGGIVRTELEFKILAKKAGFQGFKVACSAYDIKVMEFIKNNA
ncbi:uncharacterized protein LOC130825454 [Amaranthus tricolor]|uniref:uncharacterized protein LOC130825454 n=1 Tax=Amaranthus tricolor TaxID=29722 RepID=UPI0025887BF8|nr:uncharacterized protein LOC130825454 [Amaranthus tricolor]